MEPLTLAMILGLGGAGLYALTRKSKGTLVEIDTSVARFKGQLHKGELYRVWTRADPAYVSRFRSNHQGQEQQALLSEDLKAKLEKAGFYPVLLASQDPSSTDVWTFIARWALSSSETFDIPPLHLYQLQSVEDPPKTMMPPEDPPIRLDDGLLVDEIDAVGYALETDEDPKHLTGFASVLTPEFPIAASLLNAKATLVSASGRQAVLVGGIRARREDERRRYQTATAICGFGDAFEWIGEQAEKGIDALKKATEDLGHTVQDMWDRYGGIVEVLGGYVPGPQIWAIETAYKVAKDINEGKPVGGVIPDRLSEQGTRFAKGLQRASPFLAMIPGVGTGVATALNAAAALALAQPLDEALIDSLALMIPGGGIAQQGFRTAGHFGSGMLRGESWDEAAVHAARDVVKSQIGEAGTVAFDAGVALARGKSLQESGFAALYQLTKGNDLADRAAHFAEALVVAKQQGRSLKSVLVDQISQSLEQYGRAEAMKRVNQLADSIQKDGSLLKMFPSELAERYGVAEEIALAAQASVKEIADGVRIIDADIIKRLTPPTTMSSVEARINRNVYMASPVSAFTINRITYASPTALKMVEATRRPEASLVIDPEAAARRLAEVEVAARRGEADAQRAKEALDRARRELERRKWVEWYKRQRGIPQG